MPSDTQQVMDEAEKLAQLVAQHPAVQKYKSAQKSVADDPEAARMLADFDRAYQRLAQQQQTGMPITDAQQDQLESLQSRIMSHIKIKALNMSQVEYVDLRRRISAAIDAAIQDKPPTGAAAPHPAEASGPRITM